MKRHQTGEVTLLVIVMVGMMVWMVWMVSGRMGMMGHAADTGVAKVTPPGSEPNKPASEPASHQR